MTLTRTLWHAHRPLMVLVFAMTALAIVAATGLLIDDRTLGGAPIWAKPLKFALSFIAYGAMWAWLISLQTRWRRLGWWLGTAISIAAFIEMTIITAQVVRGHQSHFNSLTPLDALLFRIMGMVIVVLFLASLVWAGTLWRQDIGDRSLTISIRFGTALTVVGLGLGALMLFPTPEQRASMADGTPTFVGAHSVGVPDGGAGLPLLGWSTEGGDLRIPHFVGMHALQVIPLAALVLIVLSARVPALRDVTTRVRLITVLSSSYAGVIALVTWQALRGQSIVRPDALTLAAIAVVIAGAIAAASAVIALNRRPIPEEIPS